MTKYEFHASFANRPSDVKVLSRGDMRVAVFNDLLPAAWAGDGPPFVIVNTESMLTWGGEHPSLHVALMQATGMLMAGEDIAFTTWSGDDMEFTRLKIETGPDDTALYHEAHLKLKELPSSWPTPSWALVSEKQRFDGSRSPWLTVRGRRLEALRDRVADLKEYYVKDLIIEQEIESVMVDTNISNDFTWMQTQGIPA